ncbi:conserved peptide upstream open reading frame 7 [Striga asiatica]|uniref:Conserved peptide upstream open reading frame 7 n=1 Tax=Striga asiatica TaxID=4170 RepID=A0A5A7QT09_STRAF|nr:conserved peptide upstream open reading frame 7 [Striga asiatica]
MDRTQVPKSKTKNPPPPPDNPFVADDTSDEPNKPSPARPEPTSAAQLLLSKPYPPLEPPIASICRHDEEDQTQYFQISYNHGPRPLKTYHFSFSSASSYYALSDLRFSPLELGF